MTHEPSQEPLLDGHYVLQNLALEALENVSDAFIAVDAEWRIVYANREACRINRTSREHLVGQNLWEEWPELAGTEAALEFHRAHDSQVAMHIEHHFVSEMYDVWLNVDVYPAQGGLNFFYRDVSARKAAEQTLRQFQYLSDNANDAFFLLSETGRFVYVNQAACRSLGYTSEQFSTMHAVQIDPFYDDVQYRALFLKAEGERLPPFESSQRRVDGTMLPIEASVSRVDIGGQALLLSCCRDITERKRAEAEMRQTLFHQRLFLRDILASVTEGHLLLCQSAQDLPSLLSPFGEAIAISPQDGLAGLRARTLAACHAMDFTVDRSQDLVTAASEAGMNAAVHVGQGAAQIYADPKLGTVQVLVEDSGSGIAIENLPHATLKKGYTTAGTLGHGMKIMLQTTDRLFLLTNSEGTTVLLEMDRIVAPLPF